LISSCTKVDLNISIGNGYLYGEASTLYGSYKINIQEGTDNIAILPSDLDLVAGLTMISFHAGSVDEIPFQCEIKTEETDMIQFFTSLETLIKLTKNPPTWMSLEKI
jgi:hypothetical protein